MRTFLPAVRSGRTAAPSTIGIGTGQATPPILDDGAAVTAVEPGDRLSAFVREKFAGPLGTCSGHLALEEGKRREFFAAIRRVIEQAGGQIAICDTVGLALARKP